MKKSTDRYLQACTTFIWALKQLAASLRASFNDGLVSHKTNDIFVESFDLELCEGRLSCALLSDLNSRGEYMLFMGMNFHICV